MKKSITLNTVSLIVASILSVTFALCFAFYLVAYDIKHWWYAIVFFILSFAICYFVVNRFVERFIYQRIKNIYKLIHTIKVSDKNLKSKVKKSQNSIQEVEAEVSEWTKGRTNEIDELRKLEEYRKEFIGNLSHELKTPIFNIQGYVTTLIDDKNIDIELRNKYLKNTERNVERMISLVEDLDTIHKIESSGMHLEKEKFDIVELTKDVIELLEIKAKERNISLKLKEDYSKPIWVYADKETIKQVFINLIYNSIVYGNENGQTRIGFYDVEDNWMVEIKDNGLGIEEKNLPRLFERFYRVDKSRSRHQGGTGLGLSIVKHILESHKQSINVRSKLGEGSTFSFTLAKYRA